MVVCNQMIRLYSSVSEQVSREVLCLPIYPELPDEDVERIAREVRLFVGSD